MENKQCAICGKEMTFEDHLLTSHVDFLIVCKDHRQYAGFYQKEIAIAIAGYPTHFPPELVMKWKERRASVVSTRERIITTIEKSEHTDDNKKRMIEYMYTFFR